MNKQDVFLLEFLDNIDLHFEYLSHIYIHLFRNNIETFYLIITRSLCLYIVIGERVSSEVNFPGVIQISGGLITKLPSSNTIVERFHDLTNRFWTDDISWLDLPNIVLYSKKVPKPNTIRFLEAIVFYKDFPLVLKECSYIYHLNPLNVSIINV
jgi:hypothetical protein